MLDPMIRAFASTVLLLCAVTARAEGSPPAIGGAAYTRDSAPRTVDARAHDAGRDRYCNGWNEPASPLTAAPLTLPAGDLIEGDGGLRITGVRGTSQFLRAPGDTCCASCQRAPRPAQPPRGTHHHLHFALPSPLLLAGLQTWATATPPPIPPLLKLGR